jgi:cytochrome bd-type quinol oxidase subunit 2
MESSASTEKEVKAAAAAAAGGGGFAEAAAISFLVGFVIRGFTFTLGGMMASSSVVSVTAENVFGGVGVVVDALFVVGDFLV